MASVSRNDWRRLVERAREERLLPVIGEQVTGRLLYDNRQLIQAWSDEIGYPMGRSFSITRLAQYLSIEGDNLAAKEDYLTFLKRYLVKSAESDPDRQPALAALKRDYRAMRLAELGERLNQAILHDELQNPLRRLAQLPVNIYITTSYHNFLELTLQSVGKEPRVEICFWDHDLKASAAPAAGLNPLIGIREAMIENFDIEEVKDIAFDLQIDPDDLAGETRRAKIRQLVGLMDRHDRLPELAQAAERLRPTVSWAALAGAKDAHSTRQMPSVFEVDQGYKPSVDQPLVYHLLGLDALPRSMVISEDDYLNFLVNISADKGIIPQDVRTALSTSSIVLLGYDLQDWDFRILFRGLITRQRTGLRGTSVAIQLMPANEQDGQSYHEDGQQIYLDRYFDQAKFKIYWGSSNGFVQDFWRHWQASE